MEISTDKKELNILVKKSIKGEIVLPQFQRNFVWARDDIQDLLVSITKGYFIGSFLLIRVDKDNLPFQPRSIAGLNLRGDELKPEWMVLDGQQRLTSLVYVFTAPNINLKGTKYPYRFYLDLKKLSSGNIEEAIWSKRVDYCDEYEEEEYQFENRVIPFTRILGDWEGWCAKYMKWLINRNKNDILTNVVGSVKPGWDKWIKNIREKLIPIIEIPKVKPDNKNDIGEVCAIFEKINSTGVLLSVYDLLTARLYIHDIDLHKLWQESISQHEMLNSISDGKPDYYGVLILRIIALKRGLDVKGSTIINLEPKNLEKDWKTAATYFEKALERIKSTNQDGFGAFQSKWIPYSTMIPVLAALQWNIKMDKRNHKVYEFTKKWYWASVFLERYSGSVESTSYRDYTDMIKLFNDRTSKPEFFNEVDIQITKNPNFTIRNVNRINVIYKGIINLIALNGAKDFIKNDAIEFHDLDDHHIFPKAFLGKMKTKDGKNRYERDQINTVLNKTLIISETNRIISKRSPSSYIKNLIPKEKKIEILQTHFISETAVKKLEKDDYEEFLNERERIIIEKLKEKLI